MHYKNNTNNPLNLHINYPIISLLEVKLLLNLNLGVTITNIIVYIILQFLSLLIL